MTAYTEATEGFSLYPVVAWDLSGLRPTEEILQEPYSGLLVGGGVNCRLAHNQGHLLALYLRGEVALRVLSLDVETKGRTCWRALRISSTDP